MGALVQINSFYFFQSFINTYKTFVLSLYDIFGLLNRTEKVHVNVKSDKNYCLLLFKK